MRVAITLVTGVDATATIGSCRAAGPRSALVLARAEPRRLPSSIDGLARELARALVGCSDGVDFLLPTGAIIAAGGVIPSLHRPGSEKERYANGETAAVFPIVSA